LGTDGASALSSAKLRAEQVGQQNQQMTSIAQEARVVAEMYVFYIVNMSKFLTYFMNKKSF